MKCLALSDYFVNASVWRCFLQNLPAAVFLLHPFASQWLLSALELLKLDVL
jgi:hypothetical protein